MTNENFLNIMKLRLEQERWTNMDDVTNEFDKLCPMFCPDISVTEKETLLDILENMTTTTIESAHIVTRDGVKPWLHKVKNDSYYTSLYQEHLKTHTNISPNVIREISETTDKIMNCMGNPNTIDGFKKKGLVVGHVQSGKTANYISLINKAADVGYKLIILLAGVHNNLRSQTQERVNEGFIGFDKLRNIFVGVGLSRDFDIYKRPVAYTDIENDFEKKYYKQIITSWVGNTTAPIVLVVKKNSSTLQNIIKWLEESSDSHKYATLLIDDEADNASINTKKNPNESTAINRKIRIILNKFEKISYVGFTATPFANIFIDPDNEIDGLKDDLFPDDFIFSLEAPSNYIGADKIFTEVNFDKYIRIIDDNENYLPIPMKKDFVVNELPNSFKDAICHFLLSIAIKKKRNLGTKHTSMLVNISHLVVIQTAVKDLIIIFLDKMLNAIQQNAYKDFKSATYDPNISHLLSIYNVEFYGESNFLELLQQIDSCRELIKVKLINSKSKDPLNYNEYDEGLNVIAVGGYSLSRGFTLEGLTTTYFLRNSKMYDTLLQMGRWFGYRDGYDDICRIYLTDSSYDWYSYISYAIDELREEFNILEYHRLTPRDYGLKVRSHPEQLIITARNKMYNSESYEIDISHSQELIQMLTQSLDESMNKHNSSVILNLLNKINFVKKSDENNIRGLFAKNIDASIILEFIKNYNCCEGERSKLDSVVDYIEKGIDEELSKWDIYLPKNINGKKSDLLKAYDISMQTRTVGNISGDYVSFADGGGRIVRLFDERAGLSNEELEKAKKINKRKQISGAVYRNVRSRPLLVIKSLLIKDKKSPLEYDDILTFGISFPKSKNIRDVTYSVNKIWLKNQNIIDNGDIEDEEE